MEFKDKLEQLIRDFYQEEFETEDVNFSDYFEDYRHGDQCDQLWKLLEEYGIKTYKHDQPDIMLELSDRRILLEININVPEDDIVLIVESYLRRFNQEHNLPEDNDVNCYGRMGRHVCVKMTWDNLLNYFKLQEDWQKLEEEFIEKMNKTYEQKGE